MPTRLLFRDDFYLSTCEATVTAVREDGSIELDQTCFYATFRRPAGRYRLSERGDGSRIALDGDGHGRDERHHPAPPA